VLLAASLAARGPLRVLDAMAGCGIRALRYGLEGRAEAVWANDADPDRLPLLERNLAGLKGLRCSARTAQHLLAECLQRQERFELVDLDGFGCPTALLPLALEAVAFDGVLYLASTDGRSPTGHDRPAAIRLLGAAARAHPASWELALRLQLGTVARAAWAMGRGVEPLFSFSEGRTFRTAVRLRRRAGCGARPAVAGQVPGQRRRARPAPRLRQAQQLRQARQSVARRRAGHRPHRAPAAAASPRQRAASDRAGSSGYGSALHGPTCPSDARQ
jgi:tRNA G26 N,N-dimethylase Trm1